MFVTPSVCSWCPSVTIAVMSEAPATLALPVAETAPPSGGKQYSVPMVRGQLAHLPSL